MFVERKETIFLTKEEVKLLNDTQDLLDEIYDQTYESQDIEKNILAAQGAIFYLLNISKLE